MELICGDLLPNQRLFTADARLERDCLEPFQPKIPKPTPYLLHSSDLDPARTLLLRDQS